MEHEKFSVNEGLCPSGHEQGCLVLANSTEKPYYFVKLIVDFQVSFKH